MPSEGVTFTSSGGVSSFGPPGGGIIAAQDTNRRNPICLKKKLRLWILLTTYFFLKFTGISLLNDISVWETLSVIHQTLTPILYALNKTFENIGSISHIGSNKVASGLWHTNNIPANSPSLTRSVKVLAWFIPLVVTASGNFAIPSSTKVTDLTSRKKFLPLLLLSKKSSLWFLIATSGLTSLYFWKMGIQLFWKEYFNIKNIYGNKVIPSKI